MTTDTCELSTSLSALTGQTLAQNYYDIRESTGFKNVSLAVCILPAKGHLSRLIAYTTEHLSSQSSKYVNSRIRLMMKGSMTLPRLLKTKNLRSSTQTIWRSTTHGTIGRSSYKLLTTSYLATGQVSSLKRDWMERKISILTK